MPNRLWPPFRLALLACPVAGLLGPAALHAQYENGSVVGAIHDAGGAPVPHVRVRVTSDATGVSTETETNDNGEYEIPELRVGVYTASASAPGFSDALAKNITVSIGNRQRIDLTLAVGGVETSVQISDVALQLETEQSQRDQTITNYQSAALPLVTRNYADLLGLVTGVREAPDEATTTSINSTVRQGAYNVNGQRSVFNNFLLDGVDNNSYGESNQGFDNQIIAVPPDSVAQFNVVTNNESAEYGRSSGATINVASNAGGNSFHATVYEFIRNTDLNAAGYFKPLTVSNTGRSIPFQKPLFNRNQFGVDFGGPIRKDKFFYFVDYEGFRQKLTPLTVLTLPTLNELSGNFVVPVRNPFTGVTYAPHTALPATAVSPLSAEIVNAFRQIQNLPQSGLATTGLATNDYSVQAPFTDNSDKGDIRLDYQQTPQSSWFVRVSDRKEDAVNNPTIPLPLEGQTNGNIRILDQQAVLGYTHLFGADRVLDARVGISRTKAGKSPLSIGDNAFAIPGLPTNPLTAGGLPTISINNFSGFGRQSTNPQFQNPALLDPKINFTWVRGAHSLKIGYEYEHLWEAVNDNNPFYGSFTYNGGFSVVPGGTATSDNYFADFLFGLPNTYSLANYFVAHLRQTLDNAYVQDDWRVSPHLTLNLGVRWEYGSPYSEQHNFISNFDPATQSVLTITPGAAAQAGITPLPVGGGVYGHTLVNPDLNDFAPRVGFAYSPDTVTVLRGGFGTSYVHYTRAGSGDILAINAPQALFTAVTQTPTLPACPPGGAAATCFTNSNQGFPAGLATNFSPSTDNATYIPKNTRDSYVESWFLSIQKQLGKNVVLDIAEVGNHGNKLQGFLNGNQRNPSLGFARPYPNFPSDITEALNEFHSNYNSLQVRYEQRAVGGLTLLNSFTWEHALDNASASLEGNTPSPQDANNIQADYGQSDYNLPIADVTSLVYELPFGHQKRFLAGSNRLLNTAVGGWQLSVINTAQAGTPFNLTYTPSSTNQVSQQISATFRGANEYRPNITPNRLRTQGRSVRQANTGFLQYVNLQAFQLPATRSGATVLSPFGNAPRNPARTPTFNETDLDLNKTFDTPRENLKVQFRSEFYNLFNHTNLYLPSSTLGGTLGGNPTTGGVVSSTFEPRIIQFAVKLLY